MSKPETSPPSGAVVSRYQHRVAFFETDAMGIVHHSNYIRHLELARIHWLDEHDQPYRIYAEQGLHYATTHVEVDYHRSTGFDDRIEIAAWLDWVRGASMPCSAATAPAWGRRPPSMRWSIAKGACGGSPKSAPRTSRD